MSETENVHPTVCAWQEDEVGQSHTDCGHIFETVSGTPPENHFEFCPYCGKTLAWCSYQEPEDDDDE